MENLSVFYSPVKHEGFIKFTLPKQPLNFIQSSEISGGPFSLFNVRYNNGKFTKREANDKVIFACLSNRECEKSQLQSLTEDQFRSHIFFVAGIQSLRNGDVLVRLLSKFEQQKDIIVKEFSTECLR